MIQTKKLIKLEQQIKLCQTIKEDKLNTKKVKLWLQKFNK